MARDTAVRAQKRANGGNALTARIPLLVAPLALMAVLLQAYFWVPTYPEQTRGDTSRLTTYIESSSGDARILNPILSADSSSSDIVGLMFEGLLEYDEKLRLRPKLATEWRLSERISIAALDYARLADGGGAEVSRLEKQVRALVDGHPDLRERLIRISVEPATVRTARVNLAGQPVATSAESGDDGTAAAAPDASVEVRLDEPPYLVLEFREVEPEFLERLVPVLGKDYAAQLDPARHVHASGNHAAAQAPAGPDLLTPVLTHKPVIEFDIRRGVEFHDGHELDANDVRFTYEAIMEPKNLSPRTSDFEPIERVEVLDTHAVRVTYKRLFSPAVNAWVMPVLPEHLLDEARMREEMNERELSDDARATFGMRQTHFNRRPVGTGPFRFGEWRANDFIHLAANSRYWRAPPNYTDVYYRILPDAVTREFEFRAGAVDHYLAEPHQAERYAKSRTYRALPSTALAYSYIGYNMRREPFSDVRVRRALGMAIDVEQIIEHVLYGQGQRVTGPYAIATPWYDRTLAPLPYDPQRAKQLLAEAGWTPNAEGWLEKDGKPLEFNLITNSGNQKRKTILSVAQNAWRRIGIRCNTQVFEWPVFLEDFVNPGEFDALVLGWSLTPDPDLYQLFHSSQTGSHQLNFAGYESSEGDRLIERIRVTYDQDELTSLTHAFHDQIAQDQPYTFLYAPTSMHVLDRKIVEKSGAAPARPVQLARTEKPLDRIRGWVKLAHAPDF